MRRKRRHERRPPHDRWLVSYADFITLLFAFFVVMYSAAQLDKRRAGQLATAIQTAFLQHGSLPDKPSDVGGLSESGTASNLSVGETDELGLRATEQPHHMRDFHATILHLLGLDQNRLWFLHNGRNEKLTDFGGNVIRGMLA